MNITATQTLASQQAAQYRATSLDVAPVKLSKDQTEAQGEAALKLLEAVPAATATTGNNINIKV